MARLFDFTWMRRFAMIFVAASCLGIVATLKPADAQVSFGISVPFVNVGFYGPAYYPYYYPYYGYYRPYYYHAYYGRWHRNWCYWHPYRCGYY